MSGPIVRTGATPEFWNNWDQVFGKKNKTASKAKEPAPSAAKVSKSTGNKKTTVEKSAAVKQAAKKTAAKKTAAKTTRKK